jgi:hypothetical protein
LRSKNKPSMSTHERDYITNLKSMACGVCKAPGPSDAHELEQGRWFTAIPLCRDCHTGSFNGLHGQKRMWLIQKATELSVLNETIRKIMT